MRAAMSSLKPRSTTSRPNFPVSPPPLPVPARPIAGSGHAHRPHAAAVAPAQQLPQGTRRPCRSTQHTAPCIYQAEPDLGQTCAGLARSTAHVTQRRTAWRCGLCARSRSRCPCRESASCTKSPATRFNLALVCMLDCLPVSFLVYPDQHLAVRCEAQQPCPFLRRMSSSGYGYVEADLLCLHSSRPPLQTCARKRSGACTTRRTSAATQCLRICQRVSS